jgi:hypothetical protein
MVAPGADLLRLILPPTRMGGTRGIAPLAASVVGGTWGTPLFAGPFERGEPQAWGVEMHRRTLETKYTFGDRVRFDSPSQGCQGVGTIYGITIYATGEPDYLIHPDDDSAIQPGILENEISLLTGQES